MKHLIKIVGLVLALSVGTSCSQLLPLLPTIVAAVQDAALIIDRIERYVDAVFAAKPDPAAETAVRTALDETRVALSMALRASKGAADLGRDDAVAAFAEFRQAYVALLKLLKPLGVVEANYATTGEYAAARGAGLVVPTPLAMGFQP
jgi:hypothetical protein